MIESGVFPTKERAAHEKNLAKRPIFISRVIVTVLIITTHFCSNRGE